MKMKKSIFICRWKIKKHFLQGRGIKMDIEKEYEGKTILVTGGAGCIGTKKLFFYKVLKALLKKESNGAKRRSSWRSYQSRF
jgi:hypothetical protein